MYHFCITQKLNLFHFRKKKKITLWNKAARWCLPTSRNKVERGSVIQKSIVISLPPPLFQLGVTEKGWRMEGLFSFL